MPLFSVLTLVISFLITRFCSLYCVAFYWNVSNRYLLIFISKAKLIFAAVSFNELAFHNYNKILRLTYKVRKFILVPF